MQLRDFHHWLNLADRAQQDRGEVLTLLAEVLDALPDEPDYDALAETLEGMLVDAHFVSSHLERLQAPLAALLAGGPSPVERVLDELQQFAEGLGPDKIRSQRFSRFERMLEALEDPSRSPPELYTVRAALEELKSEFRGLWQEYREMKLEPGETTAEAVAGHQFLKEAFQLWLQAFVHVEANDLTHAREAAWEANRQLAAVSHWSDELRPMPSFVIGQA